MTVINPEKILNGFVLNYPETTKLIAYYNYDYFAITENDEYVKIYPINITTYQIKPAV